MHMPNMDTADSNNIYFIHVALDIAKDAASVKKKCIKHIEKIILITKDIQTKTHKTLPLCY